jgi:hypothetical protein
MRLCLIVELQSTESILLSRDCFSKAVASIRAATPFPYAKRPPRQRLSCVLGMFSSLEVQVLWPT